MRHVAHSVAHFRERLTVHSCPSLSHLRFEAAASHRNSLEAKIDLWAVRGGKRVSVGSPEPSRQWRAVSKPVTTSFDQPSLANRRKQLQTDTTLISHFGAMRSTVSRPNE